MDSDYCRRGRLESLPVGLVRRLLFAADSSRTVSGCRRPPPIYRWRSRWRVTRSDWHHPARRGWNHLERGGRVMQLILMTMPHR